MNYIKHLTGFFNKIHNENAINPTHISLYLALFQCWNVNRFKNPTGISREEIMKASKINSKATYHKCMKELEALGFMEYLPTYNPHSCSNVIMVNFSDELKSRPKFEPLTSSKNKSVQNLTHSKSEQVVEQGNNRNILKNSKLKLNTNQKQYVEPVQNKTRLKNEQHIEQVDEQVYIDNNKTYTNIINKDIYTKSEILNSKNSNTAPEKNQEEMPFAFADTEKNQTENARQKSCAKKEEENKNGITPSIEMILEYFAFKESSETEANKFFNYYSSIGWLVGGKTKMKDWKASARNWIMNQNKFQPKSNIPQPNHLQTSNYKNYAEPL
ncbi:transcriptional regulator [Flavobacterium sp. LB3P45]|uniref:Transcriptional regulator n=1 Tax=Flavobacterium fructosi TaxID=3230416 RepID=A0ABW6HR77_9FLAO